ncbi:MAG TPA: NAD(P)/FAD-dependent oxidoreductase [Devosia sp.]|nr:NAD(P)/FAD-dependent oxidoreductase [Devosia sp.]
MRILVIGAGISGIAAAKTLMGFGHEVIVCEKETVIGGVWATAYPGVTLQNIAEHYRLTDFPWPFKPQSHPTAEEVRRYLDAAVRHFKLDLRLAHDVSSLEEAPEGWVATIRGPAGTTEERFDYVLVATGQYSGDKTQVDLPGHDSFTGTVLRDRQVTDLEIFRNARVAVVGFGKTAVDLATFAVARGATVTHVFRNARWLLPYTMAGRDIAEIVTARTSTFFLPSWVHPTAREAKFHARWSRHIGTYWKNTSAMLHMATGLRRPGRSAAARERLKLVTPEGPVTIQLRGTMAPKPYYPAVAAGKITPVRGTLAGLAPEGVRLADGRVVPADIVVLAIGNDKPSFSYLPSPYREMMTAEEDGVQLYRHILHPRIPRLAFIGYNHGVFHLPASELSAVWVEAVASGDLELPPVAEMEQRSARVAAWKRANTNFEPQRGFTTSNHFHQYFGALLGDIGVNPRRKKNAIAEIFAAYDAADYAGVAGEYLAGRAKRGAPLRALPLDT